MGLTLQLDIKGLKKLTRSLGQLDGVEVDTGFFEDARYGPENQNMYVAQVAAYNNFGTRFNPRRPFMDNTFEEKYNQLFMGRGMKKVFEAAIRGKNTATLLNNLGELIKDIMVVEIDDFPGSNSPATIARKGFNDPLFDTGKMLESVKFTITR